MLKWLWNYGHERQVVKAKNGSILPLLDPELYNAVANENDDAGSSLLRQAHFDFANKNIAEGIYMLLMAFQLCSPRMHREATNPESWHIDFKVIVSLVSSHFKQQTLNIFLGIPTEEPSNTTRY